MTQRRKGGRNPSVAPSTVVLSQDDLRVRMVYTHYRRVYEVLKSRVGSEETALYRPPAAYDGRAPKHLSGANVHEDKPYIPGRGSEWKKLNEHCQQNNLDPILLIAMAFDHLPRQAKHTPEPGNLQGANYVLAYQEALAGLPAKIAVSLDIEKKNAKSRIVVQGHYLPKATGRPMTQWDIYDNVLSDLTNLSPLFRHCLATQIARDGGGARFRALANSARLDAVLQFYPYRQFYLLSWRDVLPEEFVTNAKQWFYDILHSEMEEG